MFSLKRKIKDLKNKIKNNQKELLLFILAFLIISLSFALGYLIARDYSITPIVIQNNCSN